ncbi:MAG: VUT family protein, partial [Prevotella sp.]|nr:VUT family protein [Prevotella sp.]
MNKKSSQVSVLFLLFSVLFCVCLIASNVFETKQIAFFGHSQTG